MSIVHEYQSTLSRATRRTLASVARANPSATLAEVVRVAQSHGVSDLTIADLLCDAPRSPVTRPAVARTLTPTPAAKSRTANPRASSRGMSWPAKILHAMMDYHTGITRGRIVANIREVHGTTENDTARIDTALSTMVKRGDLVRDSHGVYRRGDVK